MMPDEIKSSDSRFEVHTPSGATLMASHDTKATLTSGLAEWFEIDGKPVAVVGSSGQNQGDHKLPKQGQVLVPMPTDVIIQTGEAWFTIDGKPIATTESKVSVPDVKQPLKSGVIEADNGFLFVNDAPPPRGA